MTTSLYRCDSELLSRSRFACAVPSTIDQSRSWCTPCGAQTSTPRRHPAGVRRSPRLVVKVPTRHVGRPHTEFAHVALRYRLDRLVEAGNSSLSCSAVRPAQHGPSSSGKRCPRGSRAELLNSLSVVKTTQPRENDMAKTFACTVAAISLFAMSARRPLGTHRAHYSLMRQPSVPASPADGCCRQGSAVRF